MNLMKAIKESSIPGIEHNLSLNLEDEGIMELTFNKNGVCVFTKITGDYLSVEELKKMQDFLQLAIDYQEAP